MSDPDQTSIPNAADGLSLVNSHLTATLGKIEQFVSGHKTAEGLDLETEALGIIEPKTRNGAGMAPPKKAAAAPKAVASSAPKAKTGARQRRPRGSSVIMTLLQNCRFWHGRDGEGYVTWFHTDHFENAAIRSAEFRRWVCYATFLETQDPPSSQSLEDALKICEAMAFEGEEQDPMLRVGAYGPDRYIIDLCDRDRRYIEVTRHGWQIVGDGKTHFIRSPAMLPLCEPEPGGDINALRPFLNVASDHDFVLVVACLMAYLRPSGPYPILVVNGEQGSGKSTFSRIVRKLFDPNTAPIRAVPLVDRDLMVAAYNAHALVFDNISKLPPEMSDAFCRMATGGGWAFRQLFADKCEAIFYGCRAILINGIPVFVERADLADRSIGIRLRTISETERRTEEEFWRDFDAAAPSILGALLDAVATGIRKLPETHLRQSPRLADFARWVSACEEGLGWARGTFMTAYTANRNDVNDGAFEADSIAVAIRDLIADDHPRGWHGTPTELLGALNLKVAEDMRRSKGWPWTVHALGSRVDRAAPLLRRRGLIIQRRQSGIRTIAIVPAEQQEKEE